MPTTTIAGLPCPPLRCSMKALVASTIRTLLLRNGCSECEVGAVGVDCREHNGTHPSLATVTAADGQELVRIGCLEDLDRLLANPLEGLFLARRVRSALDCESG